MDLLKDKGIAPQTDVNSTNNVVSILNGLFASLSLKIEQSAGDYDFMDLLRDNGHVPVPINDNERTSIDLVSLMEVMARKMEHSAGHYDFMDLMYDKGFVPTHSNDNDFDIQVA